MWRKTRESKQEFLLDYTFNNTRGNDGVFKCAKSPNLKKIKGKQNSGKSFMKVWTTKNEKRFSAESCLKYLVVAHI